MATLGLNPISLFPTTTTTTTRGRNLLLLCDRYEFLEEISRGAYGAVFKARDTKTGRIVAVKREFDGDSILSQREINILSALPRHPSIVEYCDCPVDDFKNVYIVMEYLETDLHRFMESRRRRAQSHTSLSLTEVKRLMWQLLEGVELLHESGVMHRDLKPSNILVDQTKNQLKIGDFGLSRFFDLKSGTVRDSQTVCSLWYRAPELLLKAHEYSCAIDMWSVGCIMAELLLNEVLFRGNCEFSQLACIYTVLGMQGFSSLPRSEKFLRFCKVEKPYNLLASKFIHLAATYPGPPMVTGPCIDLMTKLLKYDPKQRITAAHALRHAWFKE